MRTFLAMLTLGLALGGASAPLTAQPPASFGVPTLDRGPEPTADEVPTHEVLLPADIVLRPGETPAEALTRALSDDEDER